MEFVKVLYFCVHLKHHNKMFKIFLRHFSCLLKGCHYSPSSLVNYAVVPLNPRGLVPGTPMGTKFLDTQVPYEDGVVFARYLHTSACIH